MADAPPPGYRRLALLDRDQHRGLGPSAQARARFHAGLHAVPLVAAELIQAARDYPAVFVREPSHGEVVLLAITGLHEGRNLFCDASGAWDPRAYQPAYLRRWPLFGAPLSQPTPDGADTAILVDPDALAPDTGAPLIAADGAPGPDWSRREALVRDLEAARRQTGTLTARLDELGLLEPFEAHAFGRDGRDHHLRGMLRVSEDRLNALDAKVIKRLMQRGELSRIYAHLMSLDNFKHLLDRAAGAPTDGG